jgi:teichoic acid transport system permease protein
MNKGAKSVTSAGKMVSNTAFPKALLPLSSVRLALNEFWPSIVVLVFAAVVSGVRPQWTWFYAIPVLVLLTVFCAGAAMIVATMQVYFRDTKSFLPYFLRLWFFATPVLWTADLLPKQADFLRYLNPMFDFVSTWSYAIVYGQAPSPSVWLVMAGWALAAFVIGGYLFTSRERDFAVRL